MTPVRRLDIAPASSAGTEPKDRFWQQVKEPSMPTNHISIEDSTHTLPDPDNGDIDFTQQFNAPGLNRNARPFLSYRVNPSGQSVSLHIDLTGTRIVDETFNTDPVRSLNEIFDHGVLLEQGNILTVTRQAGPGSLGISDIIICYSAD